MPCVYCNCVVHSISFVKGMVTWQCTGKRQKWYNKLHFHDVAPVQDNTRVYTDRHEIYHWTHTCTGCRLHTPFNLSIVLLIPRLPGDILKFLLQTGESHPQSWYHWQRAVGHPSVVCHLFQLLPHWKHVWWRWAGPHGGSLSRQQWWTPGQTAPDVVVSPGS